MFENSAFPVSCVAKENFQSCPNCQLSHGEVSLRHWRYAWTIDCLLCGTRLHSRTDKSDPPEKLVKRARKGAGFLEFAYFSTNRRLARRVQTAITFAQATHLRQRHCSLIGLCQRDRFELLAAIGAGRKKPLIKAALVLRETWGVERRLNEAFPYRRKLIARVLKLRRELARRMPTQFRDEINLRTSLTTPPPKMGLSPYNEAARKAIQQLGVEASQKELLKCADQILARSKWTNSEQ